MPGPGAKLNTAVYRIELGAHFLCSILLIAQRVCSAEAPDGEVA